MLKYVLSRLLTFIPTFIGVTIVSFGFIRVLPGDPIIVMAGERGMDQERYNELMDQYGFNDPLLVQFWDYLTGVLQGDLGQSFVTKRPVWDEFFALFPATLELSICAIILAVLLGIPAGVIAATRRPGRPFIAAAPPAGRCRGVRPTFRPGARAPARSAPPTSCPGGSGSSSCRPAGCSRVPW